MAQQTPQRNPFLLMIDPDVVLAAIEKSERLGQLNRHLYRPLDRHSSSSQAGPTAGADAEDGDGDEDDLVDDDADGNGIVQPPMA